MTVLGIPTQPEVLADLAALRVQFDADLASVELPVGVQLNKIQVEQAVILAAVTAVLSHVTALEAKMSALDDAITQLQTDVTNLTTVDQSAMSLITGFAAQLAAAIAAATAAGASTAQLQSLTDLHTTIVSNDTGLAAAVAANTPAPPPVPGP